MPWKENLPMEQRVELVREWKEGENITALAEAYGVSRKTVYKWIARQSEEGTAGLEARSCAPHNSPQQWDEEMIQRVIEVRQRWGWGPRKLRCKLQQAAATNEKIPCASTIAEILRDKGLSRTRKRHARTPLYEHRFAGAEHPNHTWCADFKGWFRTGDGQRCDPLTISDAHSRYLLCCQIATKTDTAHIEALFDTVFREYGLPDVIHTDNGVPFASRAPKGLSRLSLRWVRLGITVERSRPASPQDNGRHERMHRTLKQETLKPPERNRQRQQATFRSFQQRYNEDRPHQSLDYCTPASRYVRSAREFPRRVPEVSYDSDMHVRRSSQKGDLNWKGKRFFVSEIFGGQRLGLRPSHDRFFEVFYGPLQIGWFDTYRCQFMQSEPRLLRTERLCK